MSFAVGDIILNGKYRLDMHLGQGAFGEVYRAVHVELRAPRALKVLRHDAPGVGSSDYGRARERFRLEAQLGAQLKTMRAPHVIEVYDFEEIEGAAHGAAPGALVLVMEYASGGSLADRIAVAREQGMLFPVEEVVRIAREIATGLAALHALDVVHRDVKPSNILFDAKDRVMLADFGLAQVPGGASDRSRHSLGVAHPGTPAYMSPEQQRSGHHLTPASDMYALGLVMFEMLTGRLGRNVRVGTPPRALRPDPPAWVDVLVMRCLAEDPDARPWDGAEFVEALAAGEAESAAQAAQAQAARAAAEQAAVAAQWRVETEAAIAVGTWSAAKMAAARWLALVPEDANAQAAQRRIEKQLAATSMVKTESPKPNTSPTLNVKRGQKSLPAPTTSKQWLRPHRGLIGIAIIGLLFALGLSSIFPNGSRGTSVKATDTLTATLAHTLQTTATRTPQPTVILKTIPTRTARPITTPTNTPQPTAIRTSRPTVLPTLTLTPLVPTVKTPSVTNTIQLVLTLTPTPLTAIVSGLRWIEFTPFKYCANGLNESTCKDISNGDTISKEGGHIRWEMYIIPPPPEDVIYDKCKMTHVGVTVEAGGQTAYLHGAYREAWYGSLDAGMCSLVKENSFIVVDTRTLPNWAIGDVKITAAVQIGMTDKGGQTFQSLHWEQGTTIVVNVKQPVQ